MRLDSVYDAEYRHQMLWLLLEERQPHQSISHKGMPTWEEHVKFVDSQPYPEWWFIIDDVNRIVGSIYLTDRREIGVHIFQNYMGEGLGRKAVKLLMETHSPPLYANINPDNESSMSMFGRLGFKHIQNTYRWGE